MAVRCRLFFIVSYCCLGGSCLPSLVKRDSVTLFSLIFGMCIDLFTLPLGAIGRLCSMIVALSA